MWSADRRKGLSDSGLSTLELDGDVGVELIGGSSVCTDAGGVDSGPAVELQPAADARP